MRLSELQTLIISALAHLTEFLICGLVLFHYMDYLDECRTEDHLWSLHMSHTGGLSSNKVVSVAVAVQVFK